MRILLSCLGKVANQKGGIEKVLCNMANALCERGHEVCIVTFEESDGRPFFPLCEGVKYINAGLGHKQSRLFVNIINAFTRDRDKREFRRMMAASEACCKPVKKVVDDFMPDVIVTFESRSVVVFNEFIKPIVPVVTMFHFNTATVLKNKYLRDYYAKSDCIQVLTKSEVEQVKDILKIKEVVCISNAVPQYEQKADLSNKIIIYVARVEEHKQQHMLIDAMIRLRQKYPEWQLQLWGDTGIAPEYYKELQEKIKKFELGQNVFFCGVTENIKEKLQNASIMAFPSVGEGFGIALAEGMSMGLPAVGFKDAVGVKSLINDKRNGFLVEHNVNALAAGLEKLMDDESLRSKLGQQAKLDMQAFHPNKIWEMWEELLEKEVKK